MSATLLCARRPAGGQRSHFQPRLHHRSGVHAAIQGAATLLASTYDPEGASWTAFFKLPDGGFRVVRRIPNEGECRRYIDAFRTISRLPAGSWLRPPPPARNVAAWRPRQSLPPAPKPDLPPASLRRPDWLRNQTQRACRPNPATFRSAASNIRR